MSENVQLLLYTSCLCMFQLALLVLAKMESCNAGPVLAKKHLTVVFEQNLGFFAPL